MWAAPQFIKLPVSLYDVPLIYCLKGEEGRKKKVEERRWGTEGTRWRFVWREGAGGGEEGKTEEGRKEGKGIMKS